jgi:hypothetical protein
MRLVADAPNRSFWSFSQSFWGPYPHLVFLGKLIEDAFRALRARPHS